ncbi:MAG: response regulator transcription factor [Candidatus Promineifilaceae bacterium]|nr:response regulator transcription factor [Candidatus Promineifilaceae bacterium]
MVEVYDSLIRVLVVDDHDMMRHLIGKVLALDNTIRVSGMAADAHEAMNLIRMHLPDLIILDYALPGANGIKLIEQMQAEKVETPVVFLSVHRHTQLVERAKEAGAKGYLLKEAMTSQLIPAVHSVVEGKTFFGSMER